MDGEVDFVKIYIAKNTETDSVEILLDYYELKELSKALIKFEDEVEKFKIKNKDKEDLGFTHLHFKDCVPTNINTETDIVFYVNLNEKGKL